tara:strand:- start:286 stop:510 length:225 start_codon:yes stop_codon:yes gene_type:complete
VDQKDLIQLVRYKVVLQVLILLLLQEEVLEKQIILPLGQEVLEVLVEEVEQLLQVELEILLPLLLLKVMMEERV